MAPDRIPALVLFGLTLCAARLEAQAVRGELVERRDGSPIDGAFVVLLDEAGVEVARALTSAGGIFVLDAPAAGTYRLRSKRIGFRVSESPPFALADSQTVGFRLEVEAVPVRLPAVVVEGRPRCGVREDAAAAVAQLWEEVREALAAVKWTEDQGELRYTVERFERELPPTGRQVLAERHIGWSGFGEKPFRSIPAQQLAQRGYVVPTPSGMVDYYAPDADVLLGDIFLNTHCFSAREGGVEHPGLVGLAFEPEPAQKLPDVIGVLWIEDQTLELRSLEFKYTVLRDRSLGGHVEFAPLPSGAWIVNHWSIRTARVDTAERGNPGRRRRLPRLLGYRETGGMVSTINSPTGLVLYSGAQTILQGSVVDSSRSGSALSRAVVLLRGTQRADTADDRGRFQIVGALDGDYRVSFQHPRLDSLGIDLDEQQVHLVRGVRETLTLFVPTEPVLVQRLCPEGLAEGQWVIVGLVRDSTSGPVPNAQIQVRLPGKTPKAMGATDRVGRFVICDVPVTPVTIFAAASPAGSGEVALEFKDGGVWINGTQFYRLSGRIWAQDIHLTRSLRSPS